MIKEKLFNETIDKLVTAYFNGNLEHGHCYSCAVGNICGDSVWSYWFFTTSVFNCGSPFIRIQGNMRQLKQEDYDKPFPERYPYNKDELGQIEFAFETAPEEGDWEFNGLMAVVEVLQKIHQCDETETKQAKERFLKPV